MRKVLFIVIVLGGAMGASLVHFYRWFDHNAYVLAETEALPQTMANGIKHAHAAAETYAALRFAGIGPESAEAAVMTLGQMNERAEKRFRDPPDSTAEVAKDMHNNYVGIVAAQWLEEHAHRNPAMRRIDVVVRLAHAGVIAETPDDVVKRGDGLLVVSQKPDIALVMEWFETHHIRIAQRVDAALLRLSKHERTEGGPTL